MSYALAASVFHPDCQRILTSLTWLISWPEAHISLIAMSGNPTTLKTQHKLIGNHDKNSKSYGKTSLQYSNLQKSKFHGACYNADVFRSSIKLFYFTFSHNAVKKIAVCYRRRIERGPKKCFRNIRKILWYEKIYKFWNG